MARAQRSIQAYARVAKPSSELGLGRKRKQIEEDESATPGTPQKATTATKKRRFQLETPPETPTRGIKNALSKLTFTVPAPPTLTSTKRKRATTPCAEAPPTPDSEDTEDGASQLPDELEDLIRLHSSFLKALSLHYAHHGSASPVDIRVLCPTVTNVWGKRKVVPDDIKLCLGITYSETAILTATLSLSDYGNGKLCLELESRQRKRGVLAQALDEAELNAAFHRNLTTAWRRASPRLELLAFIAALPRAPITECASYTKLKPSIERGQRLLSEVLTPRPPPPTPYTPQATPDSAGHLPISPRRPIYQSFPAYKRLSASPMEESIPALHADPPGPPQTLDANLRALSLFDRIAKKQLDAASAASRRPSRAARDRLAALQRCEEVAQILCLLATGKGPGLRAAFPLQGLVRSVQDSLRSPMESAEVERCLAVLGGEVAKGFVEVKSFGGLRGVVVNRVYKPEEGRIRAVMEEAQAEAEACDER